MSDASINKVIKMLGYHGRLTGQGFRHMMSTILHQHGFENVWVKMQLAHVDKKFLRGNHNYRQHIESRRK